MKLIVPDVHERLDRLAKALTPERASRVDEIIFLGDWFDTFDSFDRHRLLAVCHIIVRGVTMGGFELEDGTILPTKWLLGNHDCHYFFKHAAFQCSGYDPRKKEIIEEVIPPEVMREFMISTMVGPYLVSHAGYREETFKYHADEDKALEWAHQGGFDALFGPGFARGGHQMWGGPTWLDWNDEFQHIPDLPQIVGHTQGKDIRTQGDYERNSSWCIDTSLRHVALVDENNGAVTIEAV
jgi:hypothetical protein